MDVRNTVRRLVRALILLFGLTCTTLWVVEASVPTAGIVVPVSPAQSTVLHLLPVRQGLYTALWHQGDWTLAPTRVIAVTLPTKLLAPLSLGLALVLLAVRNWPRRGKQA